MTIRPATSGTPTAVASSATRPPQCASRSSSDRTAPISPLLSRVTLGSSTSPPEMMRAIALAPHGRCGLWGRDADPAATVLDAHGVIGGPEHLVVAGTVAV